MHFWGRLYKRLLGFYVSAPLRSVHVMQHLTCLQPADAVIEARELCIVMFIYQDRQSSSPSSVVQLFRVIDQQ